MYLFPSAGETVAGVSPYLRSISVPQSTDRPTTAIHSFIQERYIVTFTVVDGRDTKKPELSFYIIKYRAAMNILRYAFGWAHVGPVAYMPRSGIVGIEYAYI